MNKKLLATTLVAASLGFTSTFAAAAIGDDMTVAAGDSSTAVVTWYGMVPGVIPGDNFTLTGLGGGPITAGVVQYLLDPSGATEDRTISTVAPITVEAHAFEEGSAGAADKTKIAGLVPNALEWNVIGGGVVGGGVSIPDSDLDFTMSFPVSPSTDAQVFTLGTTVAAVKAPAGEAHTITIDVASKSAYPLQPGASMEIYANVVATAAI